MISLTHEVTNVDPDVPLTSLHVVSPRLTGSFHFSLDQLPPQVVLGGLTPVGVLEVPQVVRRLHARREHGGGEVQVYDDGTYGYRGNTYTSCRQLMLGLYGRTSGMTFDRYFRLGKWARERESKTTILEALGADIQIDLAGLGKKPQGIRRTCPGEAGRWARKRESRTTILEALGVSVVQPTELRGVPSQPWVLDHEESAPVENLVRTRPEGIDLAERAHEVRKLLFAGFGSRMARAGYDPDDVLQEVYKGLLARNAGRGRFDPKKSSFGHYVHMVCGCVLANYHRKVLRQREMEQVGLLGLDMDSGDMSYMDASLASDGQPGQDMLLSGGVANTDETARWDMAMSALEDHLVQEGVGDLAINSLPYTAQGYTRAEIAHELNEDPGRVGRALAKLRKATRSFHV